MFSHLGTGVNICLIILIWSSNGIADTLGSILTNPLSNSVADQVNRLVIFVITS